MLNLRQHSITEIPIPPMATLKQYLTTIQLLSPFTLSVLLTSKPRIQRHLKITKDPEWKENQTKTKYKNHYLNTKSPPPPKKNKNSHQQQLGCQSPYAKLAKNIWKVLTNDIWATNGETSDTCHQHSLKLEDQPQNIHTSKPERNQHTSLQHNQNDFPKPKNSQKKKKKRFQTSPTKQMVHLLLRDYA